MTKENILKEIEQLISSYSVGQDFQPLQIIFKVRPPLFLGHPWIFFDSLIMQLCLRDCLGELFYILPSDIVLDLQNFQVPIKKTEDVYHASVSIFDKANLYQSTIYKRFDDKNINRLDKRQRRGRIQTNRGYFKDFMINIPFITPETVTFYTCADKTELERLIPYLRQLGKKGDIGGGRILDYSIKEIEADYSFFKEGKIMRPIPPHLAKTVPLMEGVCYMNSTYKAPYWDKRNVAMCMVPESQITAGY